MWDISPRWVAPFRSIRSLSDTKKICTMPHSFILGKSGWKNRLESEVLKFWTWVQHETTSGQGGRPTEHQQKRYVIRFEWQCVVSVYMALPVSPSWVKHHLPFCLMFPGSVGRGSSRPSACCGVHLSAGKGERASLYHIIWFNNSYNFIILH